jgi:hypothetical protein
MSRCAGLDPVEGRRPPSVVGSQTVVVVGCVVVGGLGLGEVVVGGRVVVVGGRVVVVVVVVGVVVVGAAVVVVSRTEAAA